jgi:hypothetical protein
MFDTPDDAPAAALPVPVTAVVTRVTLPDLSPQTLAALAREIAMDIKEPATILAAYGLTTAQYERIKAIPFFTRALELATIEWTSALKTPDRLRIEAAATLEDALPAIGVRMKNPMELLTAVVEAGKLFSKIAGVGEAAAPGTGAPGEKFVININLGGDEKLHFVKDVTPIQGKIQNDESRIPAELAQSKQRQNSETESRVPEKTPSSDTSTSSRSYAPVLFDVKGGGC